MSHKKSKASKTPTKRRVKHQVKQDSVPNPSDSPRQITFLLPGDPPGNDAHDHDHDHGIKCIVPPALLPHFPKLQMFEPSVPNPYIVIDVTPKTLQLLQEYFDFEKRLHSSTVPRKKKTTKASLITEQVLIQEPLRSHDIADSVQPKIASDFMVVLLQEENTIQEFCQLIQIATELDLPHLWQCACAAIAFRIKGCDLGTVKKLLFIKE